ncbi:hypothetical protein ABT297_09590 [Dactylosporangium sp. NPDC000555]|uniref:hypothetical protein n=1 Tax=Dactylosporangium sp. NPDC000555 TaxID=3154260 RepID=UPI003329D0F6
MDHDLGEMIAGLPPDWAGLLTDWDRSMRSRNYPETTRNKYLVAAAHVARYLARPANGPDTQALRVRP